MRRWRTHPCALPRSHMLIRHTRVHKKSLRSIFFTITELKHTEMPFDMAMSSLKTFTEELFMAECASLACGDFLETLCTTMWEGKKTNQSPKLASKKYQKAEGISLLLITWIRYISGTKIWKKLFSMCGGEKAGVRPMEKKRAVPISAHKHERLVWWRHYSRSEKSYHPCSPVGIPLVFLVRPWIIP